MRNKEKILKILLKHGTEAVDRALIIELLADIRDELVESNKLKERYHG